MKKFGIGFTAATIVLLNSCAAGIKPGQSTRSAEPHQYLAELRDVDSKYAAVRETPEAPQGKFPSTAKSHALQSLGVARSMVGDTVGAEQAFQEHFGINLQETPALSARDAEEVRAILANHQPEDALKAIVREAQGRQIVMLNEAHHVSRHRAFATLLARELRKLGFEYLAMETLYPDVAQLQARGFPVVADGYYSREPLFGDFIRQSLAAGYQLVAYEQGYDPDAKPLDPVDAIAAREEAQAQNLIDRVLKRNPQARLFIYVGYSHLMKGTQEMSGGRKTAWLAERLRAKTGIDPLCIDQTQIIEPRPGTRDRALADAVFAQRDDESVVLRANENEHLFWPKTPAWEMQVIHRPTRFTHGRPHWIAMRGYRKPRPVPVSLMPKQGQRLIQAFIEGEAADAVPVDQFIVSAGDTNPPMFMLPEGRFRFATQD